MKKGITSTIAFELEIEVTDVAEVIFTFKEKIDSEEYLLQKSYPEEVSFEDNKFLCKLTQEETDSLTNTFFVEAQVNLTNKSVIKSDIGKEIMPPTLWTTFVEDNESSGEEEIITLTFTDYVEGGGSGGTTNYNELSNKPRYNGIEWVGNKTDSDMGIATKGELQTKADKSDTYTKEETNTFLNAKADKDTTYTKTETDNLLGGKQDTLADGNGVKIENDEISVDLSSDQSQLLKFLNGQLVLQPFDIAYNELIRQELANSNIPYSLASKSYVDNLMSGATKWEFVSQLPTENIDIHTIYFVPKESAETDNIYDEWVYAIQSRNPDVYDWELLGTSQVDLSNYYTKTESDNKYQNKLTVGNGIDITNNAISVGLASSNSYLAFSNNKLSLDYSTLGSSPYFRLLLSSTSAQNALQPKLTAGTNITIDSNNVISASGGGSYTFTDGLKESSGTVGIDLASGSKLLIDANDKLDVDLSNYYTKSRTYSKDNINAITLQKAFRNLSGASYVMYMYESRSVALDVSAYNTLKITALSTNDEYSYKLDSGTEQTFDETDLPLTIDVSNASSFYAWGGAFGNESLTYDLTNNDFDYATTTDLSSKQDTIDSTHKLSADNVDDTSTTNKFVPTHSSSESGKVLGVDNQGGLQWVSQSGGGSYSGGDGIDITNDTISVDLKSGTELQITNGELDIDLSDYYTKIETYNLAYDSTYRLSLTDTNYSNPLQTKITSNNMLSSSLINDSGSMTKLFVTATDKSTWNSKSKVFPAVYDNGALDVKTATYSHIKENDLIVCNGNNIDGAFDGAYLKRVVAVDIGPNADEIALTDIKETYSIQGTPPATAEYGVDFIYQVGNILLSENGNIYYCASATYNYNTETFTYTWRTYNIADKQDKTDITTDTSSTTVSLTLADNHEYRYTQDLTSLTLTMPSGDFISSIVFASGSTPTSMTYDSNIKWSGDDVTSNAFVPVANKTYDIMFYYNGININAISRGAE